MPADTPSHSDPALSGQIKKRIAIAAGLALVALAAIPLINGMGKDEAASTPASQPISSGKIVQKDASEAAFVVEAPLASAAVASAPTAEASIAHSNTPLSPSQGSPLAVTGKPAMVGSTPAVPPPSISPPPARSVNPAPVATTPALKQNAAVAPATTTPSTSTPTRQPAANPPAAAARPAATAAQTPAVAAAAKTAAQAPSHITLPGDETVAAPRIIPRAGNSQTAPAGSSFGYQVQLGLFATPENADRLIDDLKKRGIAARTETRVQLGPFRTRAEAEEAMNKLKALGYQPLLIPVGS